MTALVLHTALAVVLIGWAYMVTSRIPYRPAWIWSGTALVVLVGYVSLLARSVFEGSPAALQTVVGNVGASLMAISCIVCLALFAAVSGGSKAPVLARGAERADVSGWAPRDEESVIVPDDADEWDSSSVIDSGTVPSDDSMDDGPRGGRYAYASADEAEEPPSTPARSADGPVAPRATPLVATPPETVVAPSAAPPATATYRPVAPPPMAASTWPSWSSADDDARQRVAPRRALPSPSDLGE